MTATRVYQIAPVGPHPDVAVLFVCALRWSSPGEASAVLALVHDDDVERPSDATILAAIRSLDDAGKPCGPQLVFDELQRAGLMNQPVADQLRAAITSGADALAARHYAAAVLADSLRRRVASAGDALTSAARDGAEVDLALLAVRAAQTIADCAGRLALLRGESL